MKEEQDQSRVVVRRDSTVQQRPRQRPDVLPSYDQKQAAAVLIVRPCCGRQVYATSPAGTCASCR